MTAQVGPLGLTTKRRGEGRKTLGLISLDQFLNVARVSVRNY